MFTRHPRPHLQRDVVVELGGGQQVVLAHCAVQHGGAVGQGGQLVRPQRLRKALHLLPGGHQAWHSRSGFGFVPRQVNKCLMQG